MTNKALPSAALVLAAALAALLLPVNSLQADGAVQEEPMPPTFEGKELARRTMGPKACGECHEKELAAWQASPHHTSWKSMHRSPVGKEMASRLKMRRIKKEPACIRCHYTELEVKGKVRARDAVSCESCHGAARDWIKVHDDFGGKGLTARTESPSHRTQRWLRSIQGGMRRPDQLYFLARRCFECHVMDDARVVEEGGHSLGEEFELLSWSQGNVRHNFVQSEGRINQEAAPARRRVLFGLGRLLEVEQTLRVLSGLKKGALFDRTAKRLQRGRENLEAMAAVLPQVTELKTALAALKTCDPAKGSRGLKASVDAVAQTARVFSRRSGEGLVPLDALMPGSGGYRGKVHQ